MKRCSKCLISKPFSLFHPQKSHADGYRSQCKDCHNAACAAYLAANRDKCNAAVRDWGTRNRSRVQATTKKWTEENKARALSNGARWRLENWERQKQNVYKWRAENLEKERSSSRESARRRRAMISPVERITDRIHHGVATLLRRQLKSSKQGKRTFDLLGYSVGDLKTHLESQFRPGMSWSNYGEWHIDHKRPRVSFKITSHEDEDFHLCWALSNLQPLWKLENLSKGAKH